MKFAHLCRAARTALLISTAAIASSAFAATITVTTLADDVFVNSGGATFSDTALTVPVVSTACTLRMALAAANTDSAIGGCAAGSGADIIDIPLTGTIELADQLMTTQPASTLPTAAYLVAVREVTINGPTTGTLVISGAKAAAASGYTMLAMTDFNPTLDTPMAINRVTFEKGRATTPPASAGCIFSRESVSLTDVKFDRCEGVGTSAWSFSALGGALAVYAQAPTDTKPNVTMLRATATGNRAIRGTKTGITWGGFAQIGNGSNNPVGAVSITDSTFSLNSAERAGAVHINNANSVTITNSRFLSNTATGTAAENAGRQGGFHIASISGNVTISGIGVVGNTAKVARAGFSVFTVGGSVSISDSYVGGNLALEDQVGGFEVSTDNFNTASPFNCLGTLKRPVTITNVDVAGNLATTNNGGLRVFCSGAVVASGLNVIGNEVSGSEVTGVFSGNGAGAFFDNDSVTVTNSTISGNKTFAGVNPTIAGFGNFRVAGNGAVVLSGLTVKGNRVENNEAGISIFAGAPSRTVSLENSAFFDNSAKSITALLLQGEGTFSVKNSTFA